MMFDWIGYLHLARTIVETGQPAGASEEARLRCAVSRAYYAAFGRAAVYLSQVFGPGFLSEDAEVHAQVATWFRQDPDPKCKLVGKALDELREWRNDADYESEAGNWQKYAIAALIRAEDSITRLAGLNGAPLDWA
jgi:uncharacterized protein (UPF0332 family)